MAKEIYSNGCISFLSAAILATDTSFQVVDGNWPTGGQFTVLVDTEYMLVTNVAGSSPSTLTVVRAQEGSAAAVHNKNALIYVDFTVGALTRFFRQSLNGTNVSTRRELNFLGSNVTLVDNPTLDTCDVTITAGSAYVAPPTTGWTLLQGTGATGSFTPDSNGVTIAEAGATSGGNENIKFLYRSLPSTPFKIAAKILYTPSAGNANSNYGMMIGEASSGKLQAIGYFFVPGAALQLNAWCWSNPNTFSANPKTQSFNLAHVEYVQISYDGTNISFAYSNDGINFVTYYTQTNTTFFTTAPDRIGFYYNANSGTGPGFARLVHWKVT